jgi:hypothetical protein
MSNQSNEPSQAKALTPLLRWYPPTWRERYGDEFVATMEDGLEGRRPTIGFRARIAWAGLRERGHETGLLGNSAPTDERIRTGSLLVLCAFASFAVAGAGYAKISEHFGDAVPRHLRALPNGAYWSLIVIATLAGLAVLAGAAAATPAFIAFLRTGGWPTVRRHVLRATALTLLAIAATVGLAAWAHTLTPPARNGGNSAYTAGFVAYALLIVATLTSWTIGAVATARRLRLSPRVLAIESVLAITVASLIVLMTAAGGLWWAAIAHDAPWFFAGRAPGGNAAYASWFEPRLAVTMALMVASTAVALFGVKVVRSGLAGRSPRPAA